MTVEQMMLALDNLRRQAKTGLAATQDEGHAFALMDVERMAAAFMEILRVSHLDGISSEMVALSIRAEVQRFVTERGWAV